MISVFVQGDGLEKRCIGVRDLEALGFFDYDYCSSIEYNHRFWDAVLQDMDRERISPSLQEEGTPGFPNVCPWQQPYDPPL